jgi:hypothetical protein
MKKVGRILLVLFLVLSLNGCDSWDDWFDGESDSSSDTLTIDDAIVAEEEANDVTITTLSDDSGLDSPSYADYFGLTNGGRPTFYWYIDMAAFPATFTLEIPGCLSATVENNGVRWEGYGWILKQSHVIGRGMALIGSGCYATEAYVWW